MIETPLIACWDMWLALFAYWVISALFTRRTKFKESFLQRLAYSVPLLLAYFLIFDRHGHFLLFGEAYETGWRNGISYVGIAATAAGIIIAVWARIHLGKYWSGIITLKEGHKVIDTGPYRFVRHPIYTGWTLALIGSAIAAGTMDGFLGVELAVLGFLIKLQREERLLTSELGDEYRKYSDKVSGAIVPFSAATAAAPADAVKSDAFTRQTLRSERYRAIGLICICAAFIIYDLITMAVDRSRFDFVLRAIVWWAALAIYELMLLKITEYAEWRGRLPRFWVWAVSTAIECFLPTLALLGLTAYKDIGPYRALVSSTVLLYCLFIILSTLRLSPMLCIVAGLASSLGYAGLFLFTLHVAPDNRYRHVMPDQTYFNTALYLFGAGVIAAAVARQIRRHVFAALAEAETRRKLDRMEYDINVARSIQMGLLPKQSPSVPGYDIAGWSKPADQTGGDYYDWIELPGGKIMFVVADAAGHGIGPALLIAACRAYFRAVAARNDPLESITAQVDALVSADVPAGRFITAVVALLDSKSNRLSLYSAGHGPLFHYIASTNEIQALDADQPPLGTMFGGEGSVAREIPMEAGDALILVTDGFFECNNAVGEMLGAGRLGELFQRHMPMPAAELIQRVYAEVLQFCGGTPQADDLTAVAIKRHRDL